MGSPYSLFDDLPNNKCSELKLIYKINNQEELKEYNDKIIQIKGNKEEDTIKLHKDKEDNENKYQYP